MYKVSTSAVQGGGLVPLAPDVPGAAVHHRHRQPAAPAGAALCPKPFRTVPHEAAGAALCPKPFRTVPTEAAAESWAL